MDRLYSEQSTRRSRDARAMLLRLPFLLLIPLGLLVPRIFAARSEWVERVYCADIYPAVRHAIATLTRGVPFSAAEWLLYAVALGCALLLLVRLIGVLCGRRPFWRFLRALVSVGIAFGVLLNLFYATWGLCYFRTPLSERMELSVAPRAVDELITLTEALARDASALRVQIEEDENGVFTVDTDAAFSALPDAYAALAAEYPVFAGEAVRTKRVAWSEGLSWLGIAGIYIGLTAEPNVNVHQTPLLIPSGAAHEMAHGLGIASENEAEFTAVLACRASGDPSVRYGGTMHALLLAGNALAKADRAAYTAIVNTVYSDGMRRDFADYKRYWDAYEGEAQEMADRMNDNYLKHNAQPSGVKSYGESVDLMLAFEAATGHFSAR